MEERVFDLVQSEIKRRFDQSGMEIASRREETLLAAAKGSVGTEEDLRSLQLPENIHVSGLHMQMRMLGDLTNDEDFCTVHELAVYVQPAHANKTLQRRGKSPPAVSFHAHLRGLFREILLGAPSPENLAA